MSRSNITSFLGLLKAPAEELDSDECEDDDDNDGDSAVDAVTTYCIGRGLSEVVGDETDCRGPDNSAGSVPEKKFPPRHMADAGDPGRGDAENCHKASD